MSDTDSSPESLRKFLESDDPSLVLMGLSMAKEAGIDESLLPALLRIVILNNDEKCTETAEQIVGDYDKSAKNLLSFLNGHIDQNELSVEQLITGYNLVLKYRRETVDELVGQATEDIGFVEQGQRCFEALVSRKIWNWQAPECESFPEWLSSIWQVYGQNFGFRQVTAYFIPLSDADEGAPSDIGGAFKVSRDKDLTRQFVNYVSDNTSRLAQFDYFDFDQEECEYVIAEEGGEWIDPENHEAGVYWFSDLDENGWDYDGHYFQFAYEQDQSVNGEYFYFEEFLSILNGLGFSLGETELEIEHKIDVVSFFRDIPFGKILLQFWNTPRYLVAVLSPATWEHADTPTSDSTLLGINKVSQQCEYFRFYNINI